MSTHGSESPIQEADRKYRGQLASMWDSYLFSVFNNDLLLLFRVELFLTEAFGCSCRCTAYLLILSGLVCHL